MRPGNWRKIGEDEIVEFDVHCKMNRAWANEFMSMLKLMQSFGELGTSRHIDIYSDGDGDFRPKFEIDREYKKTDGFWSKDYKQSDRFPKPEVIFDAG